MTFEFDLRIAAADREGYYITRWDLAQKITVRAETKDEAFKKAWVVMGEAPPGRYWTGKCDSIHEVDTVAELGGIEK